MDLIRKVSPGFWRNKKVFLTGHTGFKGGWLSVWLQTMGSVVKGYALEPSTDPSFFDLSKVISGMESEMGDIRNLEKLQKSMNAFNPDILIHMAAQPLVRLSYEEPVETYSTNVMGTVNVLESARSCTNLKAIISVTTDKCYENKEWDWGYRENEAMGGHDPYSSSKGCAELVTSAYRRSFFSTENQAALASVRAGNVIGGGDWSLDRLIPDIINALERSESVVIRNPNAIRPWQHVLEPLGGYLLLAENLFEEGQGYAESWNFGPADSDVKNVEWITKELCSLWETGAEYKFDDGDHPHEANYLKLDCSKAKNRMGWIPKWDIQKTLQSIVDWHVAINSGENARDVTEKQIREYTIS